MVLTYWIWLPTCENTLLAFAPISRTVLATMTRTTASMTAYSATSCPSSLDQSLVRRLRIIFSIQTAPEVAEALDSGCVLEMKRFIPQPSLSCEKACRPIWYSPFPSSNFVHTTVNSMRRWR
jgi:hypothetical protein